jgi:hypothetical protein
MGNWDDPKVVISNNGYFDDTTNEDGLLTARRIEQRCISKFGFRPVVVMGEYGFDKGFTSVHGWRVSQMNGAQMVGKVIDHAQHIAGMAACVYGVGFSEDAKVKTFHLDNAELELLMKLSPVYAPPGPVVILEPPTEEPPVITPPPVEIAWNEATATIGKLPDGKPDALNVRKAPSTTAEIVAQIVDGSKCAYQLNPTKIGNWWWLRVRNAHDVEGYGAILRAPVTATVDQLQDYIDMQFKADGVVVPDEPPPPPDPVYITLTEAQQMVDAAKEATMSYMKEWTLSLLVECAKADSAALLAKMELLNPMDVSKQEVKKDAA